MTQQDLQRTIQIQQKEINQLREQLGRNQAANFELKYKKALQQISGIIKANRQLKEQLNRLTSFKANEGDNFNKINKQQIGKAYQKVLKEKNQLLGQKQALQLQIQTLRNSNLNYEDTISKLKAEKLALARQKQGITKLNGFQRFPEGFNDKLKEKDFKQREAELRKTLQNYQQRHSSLTINNRKLEQRIIQLENKLYDADSQFKNKLNQKDIQVKISKSAARQQFQVQIANLKRQISHLKLTNNQLTVKLNVFTQSQKISNNQPNQYEQQLIQTLRQLKMQMEPMSVQIAELQEKNEFEKEQTQRQLANLQIKVMEYEAQLEGARQRQKILQQKVLKQVEKSRKWDESQRTIKKLEEQNKILGGKVIVLQAKEVALRNRSGDQLQQRVLQFRTRVQMLLSDKQTIANMKNVNIHQLIALKAYILELDAKLKQVVNENEYAVKKYKSYKQKCTQLIRDLKQHDIAMNALKGKLQGYDRLVVKLQGELERAITINDSQMKAINVKITQTTANSIDIYKKKYQSLLEKLSLQEKYAQQQIQTLKLNYDTKILDLNLKLQQLSSIRDTIGLYKSKNEQLATKLTLKQNQLLQTKMTKVVITDTVPQLKNPHKQAINKLHQTINLKQSTILALQNQIRKVQQEWKGKYNQLQQTTTATLSKKSREDDDKKRQIQHLQDQIRSYRTRIGDLQTKTLSIPHKNQDQSFNKAHHFTGQISDLQVQLEDWKNRYEIQNAKVSKLTKINNQLKQVNSQLEGQVSRLKFEIKRIDKELHLQIQDKNSELKRFQSRNQQSYIDPSRIQKTQSDANNFKINSLKMQLQMLKDQNQQLQNDKQKYYNRSIQLQRQVSELSIKLQQLNYTLQRTKNSINNDMILRQTQKQQQIQRFQYNLKSLKDKNSDLQNRISQYEGQITKTRNQINKQRQRLHIQLDNKQDQISKLLREINRIRGEVNNHEEAKVGLQQQYQYKMMRLNNENLNLRDQIEGLHTQIQKIESQVKFLRNRQIQYNTKSQSHQNYVINLSNNIKQLQNKQIQMQSELMQRQTIISKLSNQLQYIRGEIVNITSNIESKDNYIARLNAQNNTLRNAQIQLQVQIANKSGQQNKYNSQLQFARTKVADLQHQLQFAKAQLNRIKAQSFANQQTYSYHLAQAQEKDSLIARLQSELRAKNEQLNQLSFQMNGKNSKISQLTNQSLRLRSISTDFQAQLIDKNGQISRLAYQLNNLKAKYENLEAEHQNNDTNWFTVNRQLAAIRSQIGNYEDDIAMKNLTIERYKNDIRDLTQQIQTINEQIYEKNKVINNLNQQLFRLKLQGQERSNQKIYKLENQIYHLKSKISNLQGQLQLKQQQLSRAKLQISTVRSSVTANRYSDQQYDSLQNQYYQLQKVLTQTRSQLSQKDLEVTQLQSKVQYLKRLQADAKRRFNQQRNDLETELQNVLSRERQLRNQISDMQNQAILTQNKATDEQQWGLQLYQTQCDRLQKMVVELQEEVNSLKLKLTYMTNQQDRIIQNLTLMTLTFAEVEALRERMKNKQSQISEVRKSLIQFATSNEQITSMASRLVVKNEDNESQSLISGQKLNIQDIQLHNKASYKKSQKLFSDRQKHQNNYQSIYSNKPNLQFDNLSQKIAKVTYTQQNQSNVSSGREKPLDTQPVNYSFDKTNTYEITEIKPNQTIQQEQEQVLNNNYQTYHKADKKLNQLVNSMKGQKKQVSRDQNQLQHNSSFNKNQQSSSQFQSSSQLQQSGQQQKIIQQTKPVYLQPSANSQITGISIQKSYSPFQTPATLQNQPSTASWRYGSGSGKSSLQNQQFSITQSQPTPFISHIGQPNPAQTTIITQQQRNTGAQQQIRVNVNTNNQVLTAKALSPPPQTTFSPALPINTPQPQQIPLQGGYQNMQGRQFAVFQQPLQYPGFAR